MTKRLEEAFAQASKLPQREQDALGDWLLAELESEQRWDHLFAGTQGALAQLGKEALAEHRAAKTEDLDPTRL
jgi:hypothetical protein